MRTLPPLLLVAAACTAAGACGDAASSPTLPGPDASAPSAARGRQLFTAECAPCHASGDGFDLALFSFPDSTIVRRALGHVSMDDALDIVAHVRTLPPGALARDTRVFQPGGQVLQDDRAFAVALFGADAWPEELTTAGLLAIDPRTVAIALALPRWSVEGDNLDWMPDAPLDQPVLGFRGTGEAVEAYRRLRSDENLLRAVGLLRAAAHARANPGAPCALLDEVPSDPERCFEVERWIATLGAQHMLRTGQQAGLHRAVHDAFWDVGQTARRALVRGGIDLGNADENWATWMTLGWIFEPGNHASVYTGTGLLRMGLPRHATFVALRSMVSRPAGSHHPYKDVMNAARFAPAHWAGDATALGLRHLAERLERGEVPTPPMDETIADLRADVARAAWIAVRKDAGAEPVIRALAERVLGLLGD
ncbi:MAG TPA: hypothetical protein VGB42_02870 [Candidatus Thermoplasmatota archaeon]